MFIVSMNGVRILRIRGVAKPQAVNEDGRCIQRKAADTDRGVLPRPAFVLYIQTWRGGKKVPERVVIAVSDLVLGDDIQRFRHLVERLGGSGGRYHHALIYTRNFECYILGG